jgi:CRISPR-associated protein Cas1
MSEMKTRTAKISLEEFGSYLGREKGCFVVRDRLGKQQRFPLVENQIAEIQLRSGNLVSTGALTTCAFWKVDCLILTQRGNPVGILKSLSDDSHVRTRVCQYEALTNGKGVEIAKEITLAKIEGQNQLLKKYGLKWHDSFRYSQAIKALEEPDLRIVRNRLMSYEGKYSERYFRQILELFGESFRPEKRKTFKAYDGLNNILNLAYRVLFWKIHIALIKAKLEPYLGFLHGMQKGEPSLVCDFQDLYRYLIDDFAIEYCKNVKASDFVLKEEDCSVNRKGKRQYLNEAKNRDLLNRLDEYFERRVAISRMRRGEHQEIETLISEEALLFAMHLRDERPTWRPRIVALS